MSLPKVAYFSMEMAIDPKLYIYSGGLGYLAGSHMLSAGHMHLPMVGVTILWGHGYGDQHVNGTGRVEIVYKKREYPFLTDTGIVVEVDIFGEPVKVKAYRLEPETFGTVPIYLLTTDVPENKPEHRELTNVLYDSNLRVRISQEIILGRGGYRVLEAANEDVDVVHINEGHALPVFFEMLSRFGGNLDEVRKRAVFTTHTPVAYGNESHPVELLAEAGFFAGAPIDLAIALGGNDFSLTVASLRMSRLANAVSQLHGQVANNMWAWVDNRYSIIPITNAVSRQFWQDPRIRNVDTDEELLQKKRHMKQELFEYVKQETGKDMDPDVLTVVWARRFTGYKRPDLLFRDHSRIEKMVKEGRAQFLFAGKFHPSDTVGRECFNLILEHTNTLPRMAILPNYDVGLSKLMKCGADVWLNTPLRPMEASGTSGMSANMNGAIHVSTFDGWSVEGTFDGINGFIINKDSPSDHLPLEERNQQDYESMMHILESRIMPIYYEDKPQWAKLMRNAIRSAATYFDSDRMVIEYYNRLYRPVSL